MVSRQIRLICTKQDKDYFRVSEFWLFNILILQNIKYLTKPYIHSHKVYMVYSYYDEEKVAQGWKNISLFKFFYPCKKTLKCSHLYKRVVYVIIIHYISIETIELNYYMYIIHHNYYTWYYELWCSINNIMVLLWIWIMNPTRSCWYTCVVHVAVV